MTRESLPITVALVMVLCVAGTIWLTTRGKLYTFHYESVMGTSLELTIDAPTLVAAEQAEEAALAEILRLTSALSAYRPRSEYSRWLRTSNQPTGLSPELSQILGLTDRWRERAGGALHAGGATPAHSSDSPRVLSSFLKSYIAGRAADTALAQTQARGIVVNLGGDLVVRGSLSESVDIADPPRVADKGLALTRI